ncbi:hypothetical protein [Paraliomyxa miuraensis]|uniref:hypothetical protein n=1 Tax=Paraliomyxa miuraensis TaxID=376150 RepID=UPI002252E601|nr:hypothetical protein [Paraliomyxa miuraensis]MCX4242124.1 hypothetical protein [Paraliomyxa miuraensis]
MALITCCSFGPGCDFFQELESDPQPAATETGGDEAGASTGDTDGGPCEVLNDDRCLDQDRVASCGPADGVLSEVDCPAACGGLLNFSCIATATGQHACWCVEPGTYKVLTCPELESCLGECDLSESLACADQCFARTDADTIRIFGALVHCAEAACEDSCRQTPQTCQACVDAARGEGEGGCSLPRAVCDGDRNPDEPWG